MSVKQAQEFRQKHNIPYFIETSAKTGENVETIFSMAAKLLYDNYKGKIAEMVSKPSLMTFFRKKTQRRRNVCARSSVQMALAPEPAGVDHHYK